MKVRIANRTVEIGVRAQRRVGVTDTDARAFMRLGAHGSPASADPDATRSKLAPSPSYDSKWEERFAKQLEAEKLAGAIVRFWYHPFSMWLPGKVRYTPDFMIQHAHRDELEIVEIKGWSRNIRDGMTRLKIAASIYPCYRWTLVRWSKQGFTSQQVTVEAWG